jgi:hypothetical protein
LIPIQWWVVHTWLARVRHEQMRAELLDLVYIW